MIATVRANPAGPSRRPRCTDGHAAGRDLVAQRVAPHREGRTRHRLRSVTCARARGWSSRCGTMPSVDASRSARRPDRRPRLRPGSCAVAGVLGGWVRDVPAADVGHDDHRAPARVRHPDRPHVRLPAARGAADRSPAARRRSGQLQRHACGRRAHRAERADPRASPDRGRDRLHVPRRRGTRRRGVARDDPPAAERSGHRAGRGRRAHDAAAPAVACRRAGDHQRAAPGRDRRRQGGASPSDPPAARRAPHGRSCRSTAPRSPRRCSRASCSATSGARSPARSRGKPGLLEAATAARCSSTRSASCRCRLQAKLLRVLEERECVRVGGVDAAADRRALRRGDQPRPRRARSAAARFRQDLYYRLNGDLGHRSRRCASAWPRSRRSLGRFLRRARAQPAGRAARSPTAAVDAARATTRGPATSASCATSSSARCCSATGTEIVPEHVARGIGRASADRRERRRSRPGRIARPPAAR